MGVVGLWWLNRISKQDDWQFDAHVERPTYRGKGPRVYLAEGRVHHAGYGWTKMDMYRPFVNLLRNDGYQVDYGSGEVTRKVLANYDVAVVAVPMLVNSHGRKSRPGAKHGWAGDAFSTEECAAFRDWVSSGGSLLLAADYAPTDRSAVTLARVLGVEMIDGWATEPLRHDPSSGEIGHIVFLRERGGLGDHPITRGRRPDEQVWRVVTVYGQAFKSPPGAVPFLALSTNASSYPHPSMDPALPPQGSYHSAAGSAQGVAFELGRGRVVVLGDAALVTAIRARRQGTFVRFGMTYPNTSNRQLALNIMHWLSGALD